MSRKSSFPPVINADTRILVLGSLPGERSLAAGRYYAHPQNAFWRLIGEAIGCDVDSLDYQSRLDALLRAGIGLWDTVASARRQGSLDAAIRDAEHNSLADLVSQLPQLRAVAFNGATAARIGSRALAGTPLTLLALPSSSPAYAAMPYAEKALLWRQIGEFLT